ncbi:MAG: COG4280 domain-containing protein [Vulcanimicrobiaceae bacterium]
MSGWVVAGTTFLASALEFVEAATIVLAVGYTQGWRPALSGTVWALVVLGAIVAILGPALVTFVPLALLKLVIGLFLVLFGYTWLRKAIWRFAGRKALHDEEQIFEREVAELQAHIKDRDARRVGFATAFNGVLLEGLEVAVIVITFAAAYSGALIWGTGGALAAALLVVLAAIVLRKPFARVPENLMGYVVGIMLLSFGTFWSGEGLGLRWWNGEATLLWIVGAYIVASIVLIGLLRAPQASRVSQA